MFFKMPKTCLRRIRCLSASTLATKILFRHTNTHQRTNTNRRPHNTLSASEKFLLSTSGQKPSALTHKIPMESSLWSWVHLWSTGTWCVITMHHRLFKHLNIPKLSIASNYTVRSSQPDLGKLYRSSQPGPIRGLAKQCQVNLMPHPGLFWVLSKYLPSSRDFVRPPKSFLWMSHWERFLQWRHN